MGRSDRRAGLVEVIRQAVQDSGLTLLELGKRTKVDHSRLSRFVRGQRGLNLSAAAKLCEELGLQLVKAKAPKPKRRRGTREK